MVHFLSTALSIDLQDCPLAFILVEVTRAGLLFLPCSFRHVVALFGKVAAGWKIYGKLVNQNKEFVNAFVADEHRCSASLSPQKS